MTPSDFVQHKVLLNWTGFCILDHSVTYNLQQTCPQMTLCSKFQSSNNTSIPVNCVHLPFRMQKCHRNLLSSLNAWWWPGLVFQASAKRGDTKQGVKGSRQILLTEQKIMALNVSCVRYHGNCFIGTDIQPGSISVVLTIWSYQTEFNKKFFKTPTLRRWIEQHRLHILATK